MLIPYKAKTWEILLSLTECNPFKWLALEAGWGVVESNKGLESKVYISLGK
jgi:hypothetical protein